MENLGRRLKRIREKTRFTQENDQYVLLYEDIIPLEFKSIFE